MSSHYLPLFLIIYTTLTSIYCLRGPRDLADTFALDQLDCAPLNNVCFCARNIGTDDGQEYELQCPTSDSPNVVIHYTPGASLKIDCIDNPTWDLSLIPSLNATQPLGVLFFRNCSMPGDTLEPLVTRFGLTRVKSLRMTYTNFENVSLSEEYLKVLAGELEHLSLTRNGLAVVDGTLLKGMVKLTSLDLGSNALVRLVAGQFLEAGNLVELDLSNNLLTSVHEDAFQGLSRLKTLHLWSNQLTTLPEKVFVPCSGVSSLELGVNSLNYLPDGILTSLTDLGEINLGTNNWTDLPEGLFRGNKHIRMIRLERNANLKQLPNGLFANLTNLTEVRLFDCALQELPADLFEGSRNLTTIQLYNNKLVSLPEKLFTNMKHLKKLELQKNLLKTISPKAFAGLSGLEELNLTTNKLESISGGLFEDMGSLRKISLKDNLLKELPIRIFKSNSELRVVDMSYNNLTLEEPSGYGFEEYSYHFNSNQKLEEMDFSYNAIKVFDEDWLQMKTDMKKINLKKNLISRIEWASFQHISKYPVEINLEKNALTTVIFNDGYRDATLIARSNTEDSPPVHVKLADNPFQCDCHLYDLAQYYALKLDPAVIRKVDFGLNDDLADMTCAGPRAMQSKQVNKVPAAKLLCKLSDEATATGESSVTSYKCPVKCECYYRPEGVAMVVDCIGRNLTVMPSLGEAVGYRRVEVLLSGNRIRVGPNGTQGYDNVTRLDLSFNSVGRLDWVPDSLMELQLANNNLTTISDEVLIKLNNTNVTLGNNPWTCDCNAVNLTNFVKDFAPKEEIRCNFDGPLLKKLSRNELCPTHDAIILAISLSLIIPFFIAAILTALYYRNKEAINVWLYSTRFLSWLVTVEDLDKDKLYDAFICFAHQDENYAEKLVMELESGPSPYKICMHRRDWMPGELITTQIIDSVATSRRTLVLLSKHFLQSKWALREFQTAHAASNKEKRARVIVILCDDMDPNTADLSSDLRAYCATKTYLKQDDPSFWAKLRYAMPHTSKKPGDVAKANKLKHVMVNIDRQELCGAVTPSSENAGTTPPAFGSLSSLLRGKTNPLDFRAQSNTTNTVIA